MLPSNIDLKRRNFRLLLLLGITLVTIILLAGGIAKIELLPGEDFPITAILGTLQSNRSPFSSEVSLPFDILRLLVACLWIMLIISVIALIVSPEIRRDAIKRIIRYTIWILIFYALTRLLRPYLPQFEEPEETPQAAGGLSDVAPEALPTPPDFVVDPPFWFVGGITVLIILLILALIWFVWRRFLKPQDQQAPLAQLTQEVEQALADLQAGHDLRDTIMRCYFEMSQILKNERGLHRQRGMTPREFEAYLAASGFRSDDIRRLTLLFESVRYGNKSPGQSEQQEAQACLTAIVQTYGQPR